MYSKTILEIISEEIFHIPGFGQKCKKEHKNDLAYVFPNLQRAEQALCQNYILENNQLLKGQIILKDVPMQVQFCTFIYLSLK